LIMMGTAEAGRGVEGIRKFGSTAVRRDGPD
jgi:hypothetical protein